MISASPSSPPSARSLRAMARSNEKATTSGTSAATSAAAASSFYLPCKRPLAEVEVKEEEQTTKVRAIVSMQVPTLSLSRACAKSIWFTNHICAYVSSNSEYMSKGILLEFLRQEQIRWENGEPLLLDISTAYSTRSLLVFEVIIRYFHSTERYGAGHEAMLSLLSEFQPYFLHQLQHEYQPSKHGGESLFFRIATASENVADLSKPKIGPYIEAWMRALGKNLRVLQAKDQYGNNFLTNSVTSSLLASHIALLNDWGFSGLLDSIFEQNNDSLSGRDMCLAGSLTPQMQELVKNMYQDWVQHARPYLHHVLLEYMIPEIANLSLDFIDGGSKP